MTDGTAPGLDQLLACIEQDAPFAARLITEFLRMGVCPASYDRDDLRAFVARLERTGRSVDAALVTLRQGAEGQTVKYCATCQGRGWIMKSEHRDLGNGLGAGGAWNEPCPDCRKAASAPPPETGWRPPSCHEQPMELIHALYRCETCGSVDETSRHEHIRTDGVADPPGRVPTQTEGAQP